MKLRKEEMLTIRGISYFGNVKFSKLHSFDVPSPYPKSQQTKQTKNKTKTRNTSHCKEHYLHNNPEYWDQISLNWLLLGIFHECIVLT